MSARQATQVLQARLERAGIPATFEDAEILRRAQLTLHRWAELECGDGDDHKSWAIERNEETGSPYMAMYPHTGKSYRYAIADREKGALRRVAEVCNRLGIHSYYQTDPRGCALYVSRDPISDSDYTRGIACIGE